jgi:hypothetical protein
VWGVGEVEVAGEEAAPFAVHAFQEWDGGVEVVVDLDVSFAWVGLA